MKPYFSEDGITIYHGDCREILPSLGIEPDLTIADPPYAQTSLKWDRWPDGWLSLPLGRSLWCFGSLRLFMDRAGEFATAGWRLSQDVIWEKHNGSGFASDRFKRVHEQAAHFGSGQVSLHMQRFCIGMQSASQCFFAPGSSADQR